MASSSSAVMLTDSEIDEEIMNEDLKNLGVRDDLINMNLQEKKNLLSAIKESASPGSSKSEKTPEKLNKLDEEMSPESPNSPPTINIDFPDLPKPKNTGNKLLLSTKNYAKKASFENQQLNLEWPRKQFCLPFYDDDDAPPLSLPEDCTFKINKKFNSKTYGSQEDREKEVQNMIEEYDSWIRLYKKVQSVRQMKLTQSSDDNVNKEEDDEEKSQKTESIASQQSIKIEDDDLFLCTNEESCSVTSQPSEVESPVIEKITKGKSPVVKTLDQEKQRKEDDGFRSSPMKEKEITKIKVQCPICQQDFLQSRIESHAAECDGFSDSTSNKPNLRVGSCAPGPSTRKRSQKVTNKRGN